MQISNVKFQFNVNSGNAALTDGDGGDALAEVNDAFKQALGRIERQVEAGDLDAATDVYDYNGNKIGEAWIEIEIEDEGVAA